MAPLCDANIQHFRPQLLLTSNLFMLFFFFLQFTVPAVVFVLCFVNYELVLEEDRCIKYM